MGESLFCVESGRWNIVFAVVCFFLCGECNSFSALFFGVCVDVFADLILWLSVGVGALYGLLCCFAVVVCCGAMMVLRHLFSINLLRS